MQKMLRRRVRRGRILGCHADEGLHDANCQVFIVIVIIINPIIAVVVVWMGLLEFQLAPVIS